MSELTSLFGIISEGQKQAEIEKAKKRQADAQRERDKLREVTREVNEIKCEMHDIKCMLSKL